MRFSTVEIGFFLKWLNLSFFFLSWVAHGERKKHSKFWLCYCYISEFHCTWIIFFWGGRVARNFLSRRRAISSTLYLLLPPPPPSRWRDFQTCLLRLLCAPFCDLWNFGRYHAFTRLKKKSADFFLSHLLANCLHPLFAIFLRIL